MSSVPRCLGGNPPKVLVCELLRGSLEEMLWTASAVRGVFL